MDLVGKRRFVPAWLLCASCSSAHGLVTIERVTVNGTVSTSIAANCIELAPQVRHCTEADVSGKDLAVRVQTTFEPRECGQRVESESFILMHYTGRVLDSASGETGQPFVSVHDFTAASPIALGSPQTIRGWTYALEGMCERQRAIITLPPERESLSRTPPSSTAPPTPPPTHSISSPPCAACAQLRMAAMYPRVSRRTLAWNTRWRLWSCSTKQPTAGRCGPTCLQSSMRTAMHISMRRRFRDTLDGFAEMCHRIFFELRMEIGMGESHGTSFLGPRGHDPRMSCRSV